MSNSRKARGINQSINDDERAISKDFERKGKSNHKSRYARNKGKGKRTSSRSNSQSSIRDKYGNDPSWYALSSQLLKDAASFSFNNPLGTSFTLGDGTGRMVVPGVQAFYFIPTIGRSGDASSPVNVASRRIYTYVRHANSGKTNYDSPDLMLYLMAVDSAFMVYTHIARVIGLVGTFSQYNRYLPEAVIGACGVTPSSITNDIADARMKLNVLGAKLNSLAVPNTFAIYKRHSWLASNVYMDSPTLKAQLYVTVPIGMYKYQEGPASGASPNYLKFVPTCANTTLTSIGTKTIDDWLSLLQTAVEALVTSEDIGIMAGDILKAYGAQNLIGVPMIPENYSVVPVYLQEFLLQISNMTLMSTAPATNVQWYDLDITQNVNINAIICGPKFKANDNNQKLAQFGVFTDKIMLNMPMDFPNPEDTIVATRDMCYVKIYNQTVTTTPTIVEPMGYGSEIFVLSAIFMLNNGTTELKYVPGPVLSGESTLSTILGWHSKFDWSAPIYITDASGYMLEVIADINNYTVLRNENLENMAETALLSMFDVPALNGFA